jgi:predicted nucleic acid-binding Zn ribbon protein
MSKMKKKRYSTVEIAAKLRQADELAAQGKLQSEIAKTLGISVMTYHRWRKAMKAKKPSQFSSMALPEALDFDDTDGALPVESHTGNRVAELRLENARLRHLVADLLLEKVALEEKIGGAVAVAERRSTGR